ncbi:MAG: hypothetical protein ACLSVD_15325 [Eggerthellaceae bacterium]
MVVLRGRQDGREPPPASLVGAFKQPPVCADTATLSTLPEREWTCGCAEIASPRHRLRRVLLWLVDSAQSLARDEAATAEAIAVRWCSGRRGRSPTRPGKACANA